MNNIFPLFYPQDDIINAEYEIPLAHSKHNSEEKGSNVIGLKLDT